jgi:translation elongation factor P/translation initiation factor 5A|tara:strand:- start:171 stop:362 length:192 start_codon:yes stop_codon:yes gene_type:complete
MPQAKDLKKGDKILHDNQKLTVESIETSKVGKLGKQKCRIETLTEKNEKKVIITLFDEEITLQ